MKEGNSSNTERQRPSLLQLLNKSELANCATICAIPDCVHPGKALIQATDMYDWQAMVVCLAWYRIENGLLSLPKAAAVLKFLLRQPYRHEYLEGIQCGSVLQDLLMRSRLIGARQLLAALVTMEFLDRVDLPAMLVDCGCLSEQEMRKALHLEHSVKTGIINTQQAAEKLAKLTSSIRPAERSLTIRLSQAIQIHQ